MSLPRPVLPVKPAAVSAPRAGEIAAVTQDIYDIPEAMMKNALPQIAKPKFLEDTYSGTNTIDSGSRPVLPSATRVRFRPFQPIVMGFMLMLLLGNLNLWGQMTASIKLHASYTDNAFQLSDYDLQRFLDDNPELNFVRTSDDVIQKLQLNGSYALHYHWWEITPAAQILLSQNLLNTDKYGTDALLSIQIKRLLGDAKVSYGYFPHAYTRDYKDTNGTGLSEKFSYAKNQYRAETQLRPFKNSTFKLGYTQEDYYYNQYFTEFDGRAETWRLGYKHSFPVFYVSGYYDFKVFDTTQTPTQINPDDSSYESNIYGFDLLLKKMPLDSKYPSVLWRPDLSLSYEEKYYQGSDAWHSGRMDQIYSTDASLAFYLGEVWNINLDYSHSFRNVDISNSSVSKYKDYSENRFGFAVEYNF